MLEYKHDKCGQNFKDEDMIEECPRCQFQQPKDRFCANCGLDMENYTPPKPGIWKILKESSSFYIVMLVVVFLSATYVIYQTGMQMVETAIREDSQPVTTPDDQSKSLSASAQLSEDNELSNDPEFIEQTDDGITEAAAPAAEGSSSFILPSQISYSLVEVQSQVIDQWSRQSNSKSGKWLSLEVKQSRLYDFLDAEEQAGRLRELTAPVNMPFTQGHISEQPYFIQLAGAEPSDERGLQIEMTLSKIESSTAEVQVLGRFYFPATDGRQEYLFDLEERVEVAANSATLIRISIPKPPLNPAEADQLQQSENPLRVLQSPDFIEGNSELLLILLAEI